MSKPFGGRWRSHGSLGGGGQGDVFRVTDSLASSHVEYALKRLRDLRRLDRFRNEIAALKRLDHPNIVKLVDHSDLADEVNEPHYLVMPLAIEGDAERRLPLFIDNIENVIQVALQASKALVAAHDAAVVHRDVKPGNILFPGQGFEIWLSDFGICHLEKDIRDTPPGAVMGPRRYAAPEIEEGISDVPFNVDVYSLGQVVFYLLSGGRTFHRENVYSADHNAFFRSGQRAEMLRLLLSKMVAPKERRIEMAEVASSLGKLNDWPSTARGNVLDDEAHQILTGLRRKIQEENQGKIDAARAKSDGEALIAAVRAGIAAAIRNRLDQIVAELNGDGDLAAEISEEIVARGLRLKAFYQIVGGARLSATISGDATQYSLHILQCEKRTARVRVVEPNEVNDPAPANADETIFAIVPAFSVMRPGMAQRELFFAQGGLRVPLKMTGPDLIPNLQNRFAGPPSNNNSVVEKIVVPQFSISRWPDIEPDLIKAVDEYSKLFLRDVLSRRG